MSTLAPAIRGSRTYDGPVMNSQVTGPGAAGLPPGVLEALEEKRRIAAQQAAMQLRMQKAQLAAMQKAGRPQPAAATEGRPTGANTGQGTEVPWYTQQAVARTPVHGFNMTGDYTIDPNKLPPHMRARQAQMGAMVKSGAALDASAPSNQPASGGFTAGQEYAGEGGEGGGPVAQPTGADERPDWLGTGSTVAAEQAAVLRRNALLRAAQQQAMAGKPGYAVPVAR